MPTPITLFSSKEEMERILDMYKIRKIRVEDDYLCLVRTSKDVFVFEMGCPHMDYPLEKANVNPFSEVICPWHGYRFDLITGDESARRCRALKVYHTRWSPHGQLLFDKPDAGT